MREHATHPCHRYARSPELFWFGDRRCDDHGHHDSWARPPSQRYAGRPVSPSASYQARAPRPTVSGRARFSRAAVRDVRFACRHATPPPNRPSPMCRLATRRPATRPGPLPAASVARDAPHPWLRRTLPPRCTILEPRITSRRQSAWHAARPLETAGRFGTLARQPLSPLPSAASSSACFCR